MTRLRRGRNSIEEYMLYRQMRAEQALHWIRRFLAIEGKRVLDVGCGHGSNAITLAQHGSRVLAVDIDEERLSVARKHNSHENLEYKNTDLEGLKPRTFDLITILDVLEHVPSYEKMLGQARDLLSTTGIIYIEYNPYYSIVGHHLYDYTLLPVQVFPYRWTERLVYARRDRGGIFSADEALQQFSGLNGITPRQVRKACRDYGLRRLWERNEVNVPGWKSLNTGVFRYVPYLEDFFSASHILILGKSDPSQDEHK